jgi:predicted membrane GTPase involved in stress response
MLKQDYLDAQSIINQTKKELQNIFDSAKPENPEDQDAHNSLLQLITQLKKMDAYYNHLKTTKIDEGSSNEKVYIDLIKRNKGMMR